MVDTKLFVIISAISYSDDRIRLFFRKAKVRAGGAKGSSIAGGFNQSRKQLLKWTTKVLYSLKKRLL